MSSSNINFNHLALTPKQILAAAPFIGSSNTPDNNISIPDSDFNSSTLTLDPRDIADRTNSASFGRKPTVFGSAAPTAQQIADSSEDLVAQILSSTINTSVGDNPTDITDFITGVNPRLGVPYSSLFGEDPPSALGVLVDTDIIGRALTGSKSVFIEDKSFMNQNLAPFVGYNDDVIQSLVTKVPAARMRDLLTADKLADSLALSNLRFGENFDLEDFTQNVASSDLLSNENLGTVSGQQKITDLIKSIGEVPSQDLIDQVYPNGVPGSSSASNNNSISNSNLSAILSNWSKQQDEKMLKHAIQLFGDELPDVIPTQVEGGALQFVLDFMELPESDRAKVRNTLNVNTRLNQDVADSLSDVSDTLDKDPFAQGLIESDGNPLINLLSDGWLVPNAFNNGIVQSDSNGSDKIFGASNIRNFVDGKGAQDSLHLGGQNDLAKAYSGDWVFARGGDDAIYHTVESSNNTRLGFVDGGAGDDRLVVAMDDPSEAKYRLTPLATQLGNVIHVALNNGQQFLARAIESIVITDKDGDVFKRHDDLKGGN